MSEESVFWVNSISVVVTARSHNPSILNRDFLVSQEIVPASWTVADAISTPAVSFVRFRNGIQLSVDEGRLTVVEECKSSFKDKYLVHTVVNNYLKKLPYVPYRSLGLNCRVAMRQEDPEWLMRRFLKQGAWFRGKPMVRSMVPKFATKAGDAECFFTFSHGQALIGQNETGNAVLADCNVHHAGPLDAGSQQEAIRSMGRTSEIIRHRGARLVLTKPANMIPYTNTSDPSYVEVTAAGEPLAPPISTETVHQVLEAQFQVATELENQVNQTESRLLIGLRLLMAQNPPMSWAVRQHMAMGDTTH